jgi:hypothetical protein
MNLCKLLFGIVYNVSRDHVRIQVKNTEEMGEFTFV